MEPSEAVRAAFLAAAAMPFLRSQTSACAKSPWFSARGLLQSIIEAPVLSRSCLTKVAVISMSRLGRQAEPASGNSAASACQLGGVGARGGAGFRFGFGALEFGRDFRFFTLVFAGFVVAGVLAVGFVLRDVIGGQGGILFGLAGSRFGQRLASGLLELPALDTGVGDTRGEQADGAQRVVIAGNHVIDLGGIAIGVHDGDDGNAELAGFADGDLLVVGVDHEEHIRQIGHVLDAGEILPEMSALALEVDDLFFRQQLVAAVGGHFLEVLEALDGFLNGDPVREQAAEPALVDIEHLAAGRLFGDGLLRLPLGADEENRLALPDLLLHEAGGVLEELQRLLQLDDVDPVALAEDVRLHLGVPTLGLVPEVNPRFEQLLHADGGQLPSSWSLQSRRAGFSLRARLALGELEALARPFLSVLFAFLHARIAGEHAGGAQPRPQFGVVRKQRPRDAHAQGAALAAGAPALDARDQIELRGEFQQPQRLARLNAQGLAGEILFEFAAVDAGLTAARTQDHSRHRQLAPASASVLNQLRHENVLFLVERLAHAARLRHLGGVGMLGVAVDAQFARQALAEAVVGQHPFDRVAHHGFRMLAHALAKGARLQPAGIAGKVMKFLGRQLLARNLDFGGVDHDHVLAGAQEGRVGGIFLAAQKARDTGGQPAQHHAVGIDDVPLRCELGGSRKICAHRVQAPAGTCSRSVWPFTPDGLASPRFGLKWTPAAKPRAGQFSTIAETQWDVKRPAVGS